MREEKRIGNYEGSAYTFYEGECEKLENIGLGALGEIIEKLEDKKAVGYVNRGITSVAKNAVLRVLAKKRRRSVLKVSNIVFAAEISAEVFVLSPLKSYTADEFRIELLKAYERRKEDAEDIESLFEKQKITEALEVLSKSLSAESRAVFCTHKIEEYLDGSGDLTMLTGMAAVMPQEFLAALYIVSVKMS